MKTSSRRSLRDVVLGGLLLISATGCGPSGDDRPTSPSGFHDESHFLVQAVVTDLLAMSRYDRGELPVPGSLPPARVVERGEAPVGRPVYRIHLVPARGRRAIDLELSVDRPIWEPSLYETLVQKLFVDGPGAAAQPTVRVDAESDLLTGLVEADPQAIEAANQAVSRRLANDFRNPWYHEQAALVLGALGLRESSGDFYDVRGLLCRMTAHLAVARLRRSEAPPSREGQLAEGILYVLMGNERDALEKLEKLDTGPALEPWKRALRARITGDYRPLEQVKELTNLEQICFFEACCRSQDPMAAWEAVPDHALEGQTDYCRIANSQPHSVQLGHALNDLGLPLEMEELRLLLELARGRTNLVPADLSWLNEEPAACVVVGTNGQPRVQVIGWGHWGLFLQRHLCHTVQQNFRFLMRRWGVPEAAAEFATEADAAFGALRLYPFVRLANAATNEAYHAAADDCARLLRQTPHLVGPKLWNNLHQHPPGLGLYLPPGLWDISAWHKHNPPPFTAYHVRPRLNHRSLLRRPDARPHLEALHAQAPSNPDVTRALLHVQHGSFGEQAPAEVIEQAYAPVLEFSVPQQVRVARLLTNNPAAYERFMSRAAARKGLYYFDLGDYFAQRDQPEKAAQYFEKGVDECRDEVGVSNGCRWLVRYYFNRGRHREAEALADRAAETYSHLGLKTKGDLLYWQGRYEESLAYYHRIEERYNQPGVIIDWWTDYRGITNDARFDAEVEQRMTNLFPRGAETVTLASFKNRPEEGVRIEGENDLIRAAGLKQGDIIVALAGRRVYALPQYIYLRAKLTGPALELIYWNGRTYAEVTTRPPNHRFGVPFTSYSTLPQSGP